MDKTAAIIILFNPEPSIFNNISFYTKNLQKLFIIDNSITPIQKIDFSNCEYLHYPENIGIASALNIICRKALKEEFDYLLTMDQDSYFDEQVFSKYMNCLSIFNDKQKVSMFGINYQKQGISTNCNYNKTKILITSGSVINLNNYKYIGGFDENLFIDLVDIEYCFRSIKKGFEIIEFKNVFMQHSLGKSSEKHSFKTFKKTTRSFHSSVRLYYMLRNFLYVKSLYKTEFPQELKILKKDVFNRIKNKLLYTNKRWQTIKLLYKAISDYRKSKMGKNLIT